MIAQTRRRMFVIAVGAVVILAVVYGFLPKPLSITAATAQRGPLRVTVEEEGRTRVKDRFVVSAPVPGYLRRIKLEPGDRVSKGQETALLEPLRSTVLDPRSRAEAEAVVSTAKQKARAAAADAEYAVEREARMRKLAAGGFIAKDELDQAVTEAKKADAAATAAKADLERTEAVLRYSAADQASADGGTVIVRAPVSGSVLKLHRESEGVVNSGDPLIDIGDPGNLEVKVEVLSADAVKLKKGTTVLFERWGGEKPLEGRVRVIEPAGFTKVSSLGVEEQRVNVIVDFTSPSELRQKLGDGYRLDTTFIVWETKDALQVPASALFRRGDGWALFVVENGRAKLIDVEIGKRNGLSAEIVKGLSEGTFVITNPEDEVRDGVRVSMRK
jgi:HlyD family secretion protein